MEADKKIKAIETKNFTVELHETSDKYLIKYENHSYGGAHYSELLNDYAMATYLFDLKVSELEGN
jgi:hypothetical protein